MLFISNVLRKTVNNSLKFFSVHKRMNNLINCEIVKAMNVVLSAKLLEFEDIFVGVLKISLRIPTNMSSNFSNYK